MKKFAAAIGLALAAASLGAHAEVLDLNIGHNSFRADFAGPLARLLSGTIGEYDVGVVERPRSDDGLTQVHGGLLLTGDAGLTGVDLKAGLGGRLLYVNRNSDNGGALALGGRFNARLPEYNRIALNASTFYAPSVTTVGRLDRYWENAVDLSYSLIRGGDVYVGYRNIRQDIGGYSGSVDNGFNLGFRLTF